MPRLSKVAILRVPRCVGTGAFSLVQRGRAVTLCNRDVLPAVQPCSEKEIIIQLSDSYAQAGITTEQKTRAVLSNILHQGSRAAEPQTIVR
jgi:hypothetical protein